jgi:hypothetical protein
MYAIHAQTKRKQQDSSARCAEKHHRGAITWRFRGLIRPVPTACATVDAGPGKKRLPIGQIQVISAADGTPFEECRLKRWITNVNPSQAEFCKNALSVAKLTVNGKAEP